MPITTTFNSHGSALGPHLSEDHHETSRLQPSGNWSRLSTSGCSQGLAFLGSRRNRSVAGWFYDVREERRPGIDPQKSVTGFRFGGRGRGRPENIVQKPAQFSRFFRCLQIFQIFRSIVVSFLSYHLSRILRPVFGKTIEKHVSRLQNTKKKPNNLYKNTFLKKLEEFWRVWCVFA